MSPAKVIYGRRLTDAFKFMSATDKFSDKAVQPTWRTAWELKERARVSCQKMDSTTLATTVSIAAIYERDNDNNDVSEHIKNQDTGDQDVREKRAYEPEGNNTAEAGVPRRRQTRALPRQGTRPANNTADHSDAARTSLRAAPSQADAERANPTTTAPASARQAKPTAAEDRSNTSASLRKTMSPYIRGILRPSKNSVIRIVYAGGDEG